MCAGGGGELPLRWLTDFEVQAAGGGVGLQPLDSLCAATLGQLVLSGQLVPPEGAQEPALSSGGGRASARKASRPPPEPTALTTGPVLDWVVDYSGAPGSDAGIWAVTQHAW